MLIFRSFCFKFHQCNSSHFFRFTFVDSFCMESDNSYVLSGSSSVTTEAMGSLRPKEKKKSTDVQSKYKQSTIDKRYGKKKRQHVFYGTKNEAKSIAKMSPTEIISSLEK